MSYFHLGAEADGAHQPELRPVNISQLYYAVQGIYDHPSATSVRFGCDCGCGGDSYTDEMWDECDRAEKEGLEFLATLGLRPWEECDSQGNPHD